MKIMKFGGTSVGSPDRIKDVARLLCEANEPLLVVLSAMSGTTNALVEISKHYYEGETAQAHSIIDGLEEKYLAHMTELFHTAEYQEKLSRFAQERFEFIKSFGNGYFASYEEKQILAQGEILSTTMMANYLLENHVNAQLLDALEFVFTDKNQEPDMPMITNRLASVMERHKGAQIYITQGYICRNAFGETDNLRRGGSDYTASLLGAALPADEIQIWTDIDGIHNNDPRCVEKTSAIRKISFSEAAELAYFGAKILHPTCVLPAKKANIPIRLKYTMDPKAEGTLIVGDIERGKIQAVAAKDNMTVLNIRSKRNVAPNLFLKKTLEIFECYDITIDMMSTSEVSLAICFESNTHLQDLERALEQYGQTTVENNMSVVCVVGDFSCENGKYHSVLSAVKGHTIKMISYGGSPFNISMAVKTNEKIAILQLLSQHLF